MPHPPPTPKEKHLSRVDLFLENLKILNKKLPTSSPNNKLKAFIASYLRSHNSTWDMEKTFRFCWGFLTISIQKLPRPKEQSWTIILKLRSSNWWLVISEFGLFFLIYSVKVFLYPATFGIWCRKLPAMAYGIHLSSVFHWAIRKKKLDDFQTLANDKGLFFMIFRFHVAASMPEMKVKIGRNLKSKLFWKQMPSQSGLFR